LEGQFPAQSHVLMTVRESTRIITPYGDDCAVFLWNAIPPSLYELAYRLWKPVNELPSNRATATGSLSLLRLKNDGTLGNRRAVPKRALKVLAQLHTAQGSLGYLDATPDQPCHKTPLTRHQPKMLDGAESLIKLVDALYKQYLMAFYAKQQAEVEKVPCWRLWDTAFTTIYLAKNFRTAYHRDSGNLKGVMTALMPMGHFSGGELVLPRWRIAFALRPGDLLFFDPQQLHGNLPFQGSRLSAAFYCEKRIADCGK
jgi:hypothetical protein